IQRERAIELLQRLLLLSGEREREPQQVMGVRKGPARRNYLLEEMNRAVVILQLKAFVSLLDQMLWTDVHEPPDTSRRTFGYPLRFPPWAGTRVRARRAPDRRRSAAHRPADRDDARSSARGRVPPQSAR